MTSIFVVGSYNEGLTIRVPRMPALGESLPGDSFDMGPGGKGSNQAIAAARLGAQVSFLACRRRRYLCRPRLAALCQGGYRG